MLAKFTCAYENQWLYNYLYGDAEYSGHYIVDYITEDKKYFKCMGDHYDDPTNRNFGFGVCHHSFGRYMQQEYYSQVGVDIASGAYYDEGTLLEVEKVEQVRQMIIEANIEIVKAHVGEDFWNKLPTNKQHVLLDIAYQYGPNNSIQDDLKAEILAGRSGLTHYIFSKWGARGTARKELWSKGKYIDASGNEIK